MDWRADLRALGRRSVPLGLLTTVLGFAGVFAVFTYIAPLLTQSPASTRAPSRRSCWCSAAAWWWATSSAASWRIAA